VRFSAEDSLPVPTSKPDPAVYAFAGRQLGVAGADAVAIEDSTTGARSAVAAGFPVVGNLTFVPEEARAGRAADLRAVGAGELVSSWDEVERLLERGGRQGVPATG
jgi:beta-phosphoglucomutase-like phosphatase (HAD superfamily)